MGETHRKGSFSKKSSGGELVGIAANILRPQGTDVLPDLYVSSNLAGIVVLVRACIEAFDMTVFKLSLKG